MKKFLVINYPGHGHVNPTIKLMKELVKLGNQVVYYCTEEFRSKIEKTGATFKSYDYKEIRESERGNKDIILKNSINLADAILSSVLSEEEKFDSIIYDSPIAVGEVVAEKLNIEDTISLYTTFAISKKMLEVGKRAGRDTFLLSSESIKFKENTKEINEKYNMVLRSMLDSLSNNKAKRKIVFTSKYYQPFGEDFDDSYKFIGPSIVEREEDISIDLKDDRDKTLVYISLGTIDNKREEFYKKTFTAFGRAEKINVILSVGRNTDIRSLGHIPENFKVYNYVPQLEVLKKIDIFITHGGMNSTSEALYNNVPLIVIPQFGDQLIVSKIVKNLGAGLVIEKEDVNEVSLRETVGEIIWNESYKKNAQIIGESLRESAREASLIYKEL